MSIRKGASVMFVCNILLIYKKTIIKLHVTVKLDNDLL